MRELNISWIGLIINPEKRLALKHPYELFFKKKTILTVAL